METHKSPEAALERKILLDADTIPEIAQARLQARLKANEILEERRQQVAEGEFVKVPLAVDPLGSARRLMRVAQLYDDNNDKHREAFDELINDSRRALAEAFRRQTWEYFPPLIHHYNVQSGLYETGDVPLLKISRNGISPYANVEEQGRRINEYVEETTYNELRRKNLTGSWVLTISLCPAYATPDNDGAGYVPELDKMMIRGVHYREGGEQRWTEQVGISGLIASSALAETLRSLGAELPTDIDRTDLLGRQLLVDSEQLGGVMDFVAKLDETTGPGIFMGEISRSGDYSAAVVAAEQRLHELKSQALELAHYIYNLAEADVDGTWAAFKVRQKIDAMAHAIAQKDPDKAREMFDEKTARGYTWALEMEGNPEEFSRRTVKRFREHIQGEAPMVAYCGAGSCGLRLASQEESWRGHRLGLVGELILDTERRCPKGHGQSVLYDKHGNKACKTCGLTEAKTRRKVNLKPKQKPAARPKTRRRFL